MFLHNYTIAMAKQNGMEILESNKDIYGSGRADETLSIKTHYEESFLLKGAAITYMVFQPGKDGVLSEPDKGSYESI
jgi:tRNA (guanine-N7-)-methyltransferase